MPRFLPPKPRARDIEIYEQVTLHSRSHRSVAQRFRLSPGTVSRICQRVATWLTIDLPARGAFGMADQSPHLVGEFLVAAAGVGQECLVSF
jgi:hypothetical protein